MFKNSFYSMAFLSLFLVSAVSAAAEPANDGAVVLEDMTRAQLRSEIEKYENEFYRVFNASVEDKKYHIHCAMYKPTTSNISVRACEPEFVVDARNENTNNFQFNIGVLLSPAELRADLTDEFEELTKVLNAVLAKNEYFRALNADLTMLRQMLAEKEAS